MLNLTEDQITLLKHVQAVEIAKKADIRFENPADDEINKRHLIALDGSLGMVNYLLDFDRQVAEQAEAAKQALLDKQLGQNPDPTNLEFTGE